MSNRFDDQFHAGQRAEETVRKASKRFTKRVEESHLVVEESIRALLEGFKETHDPKLEARNIKIEFCVKAMTRCLTSEIFSRKPTRSNLFSRKEDLSGRFSTSTIENLKPRL